MKTTPPSKLLSLDLSTHTGWAYFEGGDLKKCGSFDVKINNYVSMVKSYKDLPQSYPYNLINAAIEVAEQSMTIWKGLDCPNIVTEHTEGSKHRISQRTLEFIHYALFEEVRYHKSIPNIRYLLNSDWRRNCKCYISQWPEFQKWNKEVGKAKKKATPNKAGAKVAKIEGKVVSKVDAKKLSIHISKQNHPTFADEITNDNIADAINLGDAAIALKVF